MTKRIISILVLVFIIVGSTFSAGAVSGKGTASNPFRISTADELLLLGDFPSSYFELEKDIELTETWTPIEDFSGHFDGKGHTVTVKAYKGVKYSGFFGTLSGVVKNLKICGNEFNYKYSEKDSYVGMIAGVCTGTIEGCEVTGSISFKPSSSDYSLYAGGICGKLTGAIRQSVNSCNNIVLNYYECS